MMLRYGRMIRHLLPLEQNILKGKAAGHLWLWNLRIFSFSSPFFILLCFSFLWRGPKSPSPTGFSPELSDSKNVQRRIRQVIVRAEICDKAERAEQKKDRVGDRWPIRSRHSPSDDGKKRMHNSRSPDTFWHLLQLQKRQYERVETEKLQESQVWHQIWISYYRYLMIE